MKPTIVRYFKNGWRHAALVKQGRKWVVVRDLFESVRIRKGYEVKEHRKRKVSLNDVRQALWE